MMTKVILLIIMIICAFSSCSAAERPAHCLQPHPQGQGLCDMLISGFYYNADQNACEEWQESGCQVIGGHTYDLREDCVNECVNVN
ncbi:kunitz-type serine protease inhibitor nigrescinin-1-like [Bactrocera tryoni]|uniref:kunitz-type serine protease inhibitor nigrescinin-1-like n=1 Tax=Bactrocera tryoni TaxID=59916 RepID=UPI001A978281|nr:kunitz-type serine protease inhibitor nigrescinin-1-like [Bactrocera tryoni]XP_039957248.1 kunitz-type serine protease inhibitor nigrescinin-1-like [Bactrocera tryoni]